MIPHAGTRQEAGMTGMRKARIGLLATAICVWSAAITGPLARAGSATTNTPGPAEDPTGVAIRTAHAPVVVDPSAHDDKAHHPLSLYVQSQDVNGTPLLTTATPSGYAPSTITKYLGLTGTGKGQTIAVVVAYNAPTISADLTTFDSKFGLAAPPSFKKVSQTGSTTVFPATDANWALEASLDVEWAHALAPAAGILLVEANSSSMSDLMAAISYASKQTGVSVISNSWGTSGEMSGETTFDANCKLTKAVCVFSTGDLGNPGGYPAYSPWVIAVGGTGLR